MNDHEDNLPSKVMSADTLRQLRGSLEAELLRGARNVAFVPDNEIARKLATEAHTFSCPVSTAFVPADTIGSSCFPAPLEFLQDDDGVIVVCVDENKIAVLSWLNSLYWRTLPQIVVAGVGHQDSAVCVVSEIESVCTVPSHATGYDLVKAHLYDALRYLRGRYKSGSIVEMGTFRGGTLLLLQKMMKSLNYSGPELIGFDTFAGFPPRRCLLDLFSMERFEDRDYQSIRRRLDSHGIQVVQGDICNTAEMLASKDLLLTFFDTDNYSPVASALPICFERTVVGGIIVFDHYYTREEYLNTIGERVAAEEFFENRSDYFHLSGTGVFIKTSAG